MKIQALTGFHDILPEEALLWRQVEDQARDVFRRFGFVEIRLPILESTELFIRSIGESTDIVEKEMYTFVDKGATMRPEATASLLRAYIEHGLHLRQEAQRLFTIGPMFRHERPQKGRLRQFHQLSAELLGSSAAETDAELIALGHSLLQQLGISASLEINSLGCPACRPAYRQALVEFLLARSGELCPDCLRRVQTNPLRVLDCKQEGCRRQVRQAPSILDSLCPPCDEHFARVRSGLETLAVPYRLNHFMVRGLDYYTRTTFEFLSNDLGAQAAVGAGGRYDGLIEQLGGPAQPGIGFALGLERLVLLLQHQANAPATPTGIDLFIAALGPAAAQLSFALMHALRQQGLAVMMDHGGRGLKGQMKQAGRLGAQYVLIAGDDEIARNELVVRNMVTQEQQSFTLINDIDECARQLALALGPRQGA
ncbi:MAG: histidine--tRNA ligase [Desulfobulbaceae bacterium A2]|nr:MAG: histidine--tRNA ligase [Desulfobulbaceae bacterium A2]